LNSLALPSPLPRPLSLGLLRRLHRAPLHSIFTQLNGTFLPKSRAALTGLPTAISPHLFQEIWFASLRLLSAVLLTLPNGSFAPAKPCCPFRATYGSLTCAFPGASFRFDGPAVASHPLRQV
jgi:hypothetical protein